MGELPQRLIDESGHGWFGAAYTRGQAVADFRDTLGAAGYGVKFTDLRARRVYGRLVPRGPATKGWETEDFPDHFIEDCERTDDGAKPYWEVTFA